MKLTPFFILTILFAFVTLTSCSESTTNEEPQPIVTNDSSEFNGQLRVEIYNLIDANNKSATVYLYANHNDLLNNLPLNYGTTNNSGNFDFGYLLQGNYYLFARSTSNQNLTDTAVVQVLSRRTTNKKLYLGN